MGRECKVYCDKCGADVSDGARYYTVKVKEYTKASGKQNQYPTLWLCKSCFFKTGLTFPTAEEANNV